MRDSTYSLICSIILGIANALLYSGRDVQNFILQPVLHSLHGRYADLIGEFDGYYGLAVLYIFWCLSNLFLPSFFYFFRAKWFLVFGACGFTLYYASFLFLNRILFFAACAVVGISTASWINGYSVYITEFSTRRTITHNQSFTWIITNMGNFASGSLFAVLTMYSKKTAKEGDKASYREYADNEISLYYMAFGASALVSALVFAFLPNKGVSESIATAHPEETSTFLQQINSTRKAFFNRRILLLIPYYAYIGLFGSFYMNIYPTTTQYTKALSGYRYMPAYFCCTFATGIATMGVFTALMSRRFKDFGMKPLLIIDGAIHLLIYALVLATVPSKSTTTPNDEPSLLIQPSIYICVLLAFFFGCADHANNTMRTVITSIVLPHRRTQAIGVSRFYHALAGSMLFLASPMLSAYFYVFFFSGLMLVSSVLYWKVANEVKVMERAGMGAQAAIHPLEEHDNETKY